MEDEGQELSVGAEQEVPAADGGAGLDLPPELAAAWFSRNPQAIRAAMKQIPRETIGQLLDMAGIDPRVIDHVGREFDRGVREGGARRGFVPGRPQAEREVRPRQEEPRQGPPPRRAQRRFSEPEFESIEDEDNEPEPEPEPEPEIEESTQSALNQIGEELGAFLDELFGPRVNLGITIAVRDGVRKATIASFTNDASESVIHRVRCVMPRLGDAVRDVIERTQERVGDQELEVLGEDDE